MAGAEELGAGMKTPVPGVDCAPGRMVLLPGVECPPGGGVLPWLEGVLPLPGRRA